MTPADPRKALVLNKREVARIDIGPAHTFTALNPGWRIDFTAPGSLRVVGASGANETVNIAKGDFIVVMGEDWYLSRLNAVGGA